MKIKLSSQESRKRIQLLNSRLKILTSDIKGQQYPTSNNQQIPQFQYGRQQSRLKKNYFQSATNLNSVSPILPNTDSDYGIGDYHPQSPKFATTPHINHYVISQPYPSKQYSPRSQGRSSNRNVRVQLQKIIQSKKQFHSLIKKELSELQRLQQQMIEQPQEWNSGDKGYERDNDKGYDGSRQEDKSKVYNNEGKLIINRNRKEISTMNERQKLLIKKNKTRNNPSNDIQFRDIQCQSQLDNSQPIRIKEEYIVGSRQRNSRNCELMGTKTQQSINQESRLQQRDLQQQQQSEAQQQQPPCNQHYQREDLPPKLKNPLYLENHSASMKKQYFQSDGKRIKIEENVNNQSNSMQGQSLQLNNRQQVESLLHQMMIGKYSDQNILQIMKLVQEESLRKSTINKEKSKLSMRNSRSINQNFNGNQQKSIKASYISSRIQQRNTIQAHKHSPSPLLSPGNSSLFNFPSQTKQFSLEQEQQKHNRLIHSYKLLTLILKIKHFYKITHNLSLNSIYKNKTNKATTFRNNHLQSKSFSQLKLYALESSKEQHELYQTKSTHVQNMLKKNIIQQFVQNSNYKTFKLLANKLKHLMQLNFKTKALQKLFKEKEEQNKEEQLSKLSDQISKKSLFRTIKERYQRIRNNYSKYILLKSINRHRHWNYFIHILNFQKLKRIVNQQNEDEKGNNINAQNQIIEPSLDMDGKILNQLEKYSKAFCKSNHQQIDEKDQEITTRSADLLITFTEPIVIRIKQSTLQNYLKLKLKKRWMERFIENFNIERKKKQIEFQNQEKTQRITHKIIVLNRKQQLINKLKLNFQQNNLNRKIEYFCNITIGTVPQNFKDTNSTPKQQNFVTVTVGNFLPVSLHDEQEDYFQDAHSVINQEPSFSETEEDKTGFIIKRSREQEKGVRKEQFKEQCRQFNPLVIKYMKGVFVNRLRMYCMGLERKKLEKQVYLDTIYGGNLLKKSIKAWKISLQEETIERLQQQKHKKQIQQEQRTKQQLQKQQQQEILKQIQKQSLELKQNQQMIKQQQTLLQNKIIQLKNQQKQLQSLQSEKREQLRIEAQKQRELMLRQEDEIKQRLGKLKMQQERQVYKLKDIEENIENRKKLQEQQQKRYIQEVEQRKRQALKQEQRRQRQIRQEQRRRIQIWKQERKKQVQEEERRKEQIQQKDRQRRKIKQEERMRIEDERKRIQMQVNTDLRQRQQDIECKVIQLKLNYQQEASKQIFIVKEQVKKLSDNKVESSQSMDDIRQQREHNKVQQLMEDELSEETYIKESKMSGNADISENGQMTENWLTRRQYHGEASQQLESQQQQSQQKHQRDQQQLLGSKLEKSSYGKRENSEKQKSFNQEPEQQQQQIHNKHNLNQLQHQHQHQQQSLISHSQQQQLNPSFVQTQQSDQILTNYINKNKNNSKDKDKDKEYQQTPKKINLTPTQINPNTHIDDNHNDSSYSQIQQQENNSYLNHQDQQIIDHQNNSSQPQQQRQDLQLSMNQMMDWLENKIKDKSQMMKVKINTNTQQGNNTQVFEKNNTHNQIKSKYLHNDLPLQVNIQSNQALFNSSSHKQDPTQNPSLLFQKEQQQQQQHQDQDEIQHNQDQDSDNQDEEDDSFLKMLKKQQNQPNNSDVQKSEEYNINQSEDQKNQLQEKKHSEPEEQKYFFDQQQSKDQNYLSQQQHSYRHSQSQNNNQSQAQSSDSQAQSSHSELEASTSPQHLRLLSYAQNHHTLFMKRLIFKQFKYRSYKKQQNQDLTLLRTIFTEWKLFHQQKHSLKKYLQIYQNITQRINTDKNKDKSKDKDKGLISQKHSTRSIERQYSQGREKKNIKQNQQITKTKSQQKSHKQDQQQISSKVKYYPTSKEDLQTFQNLYPSNQSKN